MKNGSAAVGSSNATSVGDWVVLGASINASTNATQGVRLDESTIAPAEGQNVSASTTAAPPPVGTNATSTGEVW